MKLQPKAALQTRDIENIANIIKPVLKNHPQNPSPEALISAIEANVKQSVATIKQSPAIQKLIKDRKVEVVDAYYNFETGAVRLL